MCVTHINSGEKICYGDDRAQVEKITGMIVDPEPYSATNYMHGIKIMYRNDKVASIRLMPESLNVYKTKLGQIGEEKSSVTDRLGTEVAVNKDAPINLDYFYDSESKRFMEVVEHRETHEELEKVYILSFIFDNEGLTEDILFTDMKMGMFLY